MKGIHHITAITADAKKNIFFYQSILGLRLVKLTVNFDDPSSYHLYYGDGIGSPGSLLTFFVWPSMPKGRIGSGQVTRIYFAIPPGTKDFWLRRLKDFNIPFEDGRTIEFFDPEGLPLGLIPGSRDYYHWSDNIISEEHAIRGFYGINMASLSEKTSDALKKLGFEEKGSIFETKETKINLALDRNEGRIGSGSVHHIAFRARDSIEQLALKRKFRTTDVIDRQYFQSVYFRDDGGILFEIATDEPGMLVDEPEEKLGTELKLPPWLEPAREAIIDNLPAL
jgi:glyoxalase family protein